MTTNIVSSTAANALQERWERLRSHKRIISRIKLLVEWDQGDAKESANAVTVDVSHSGCMAVVGAENRAQGRGRSGVAQPRSLGRRIRIAEARRHVLEFEVEIETSGSTFLPRSESAFETTAATFPSPNSSESSPSSGNRP